MRVISTAEYVTIPNFSCSLCHNKQQNGDIDHNYSEMPPCNFEKKKEKRKKKKKMSASKEKIE